jgi:excinuclease ABC subunit C
MVELVCRNAKLAFELDVREEGQLTSARLKALADLLELPEVPLRIEAFDISNIQGSDIVASMVVFERGHPSRSDYRKFKVRSVAGKPDDVASMHEVVRRHYRRVLEEGNEFPDLVLIDGGKGQLGAAQEALRELGLLHLPMVSIAKKEEILFKPGTPDPLVLPKSSPCLQLIRRIRDEAHRFAVTFHRKRRKARSLHSKLDDIMGIGPKKKKLLLTHFKSYRGVREASAEELASVLGRKLAESVRLQLAEMN